MGFKKYLKEDVVKIQKQLWLDIGAVKVYLVDGSQVRIVDLEFTEGGHHYRYNFIPDGEIWIEKMKNANEQPFTLLHELTEYLNMMKGQDYDSAHNSANTIEKYYRCNFLKTVLPPVAE
jgi:Zn-dependent metalloprotease